MKLLGCMIAALTVSGSAGCAARPAPAVSTTQLTSAEVAPGTEEPRVGEPRWTRERSASDKSDRRDERRRGGGFSGYK